ncbi:hypothetical protein GCM10027072_06290 [Streptomyces bullii]
MAALTGYTPPSTRDTVDADTPARAATSRIVLRLASPLFLVMPSSSLPGAGPWSARLPAPSGTAAT